MKDYARRIPAHPSRRTLSSRSVSRGSAPAWRSGLVGVLTGAAVALCAGWYYLKIQAPRPSTEILAPLEVPEEQPKKTKKHKSGRNRTETAAPAEQPQFEFYTLLPNMAAQGPSAESASPSEPPPIIASPEPTLAPSFILQAGAFQSPEEADALKATLALQGLETHVQPLRSPEGEASFRVYVGPFKSEQEALTARAQLDPEQLPHIQLLKVRR